jgi:autotransporter-associated beta strand protein
MSFIFGIKSQLNAENQLIKIDTVQNFPFSTIRYQWSFDPDSSGGIHAEFLQISDTTGGDDGPIPLSGFASSTGFHHTASSTQPSTKLHIGPFDVRGMDSISFALHLAAQGILEHSDFVGIYISLNGGEDYYPQLKIRGSKSGTSNGGWAHGEGIHYQKEFRWASRSSSIYGHVDPDTKDTIDGMSAISILNIPQTDQLMIEVEIKSSTLGGESYNIDNLSLAAQITTPTNHLLHKDTTYAISIPGTYMATGPIQGLYVNVPDSDTVYLSGNPTLTGNLHIASGTVIGALTAEIGEGTFSGNNFVGDLYQSQTINDTGYHFIGSPSFFAITDTLDYCWVYDADAGYWDKPQNLYSGTDSAPSLGRLIYLDTSQLPFEFTGKFDPSKTKLTLGWADTCLDGTTPLGGWNLLANPTGRRLNWNQLLASGLTDSMDYTLFTWEGDDYGGYNPNSGSTGADAFIEPGESFWVRLSHHNTPSNPVSIEMKRSSGAFKTSPQLNFKSAVQPDTVNFEWTTSGKGAASYKATLYIDSAYKASYMSCCDQLFLGGPLAPQLSLLKAGTPLLRNHMPKSSHYPIYLVGEGVLKAFGAPGWFFLPPNIHAGTKPLTLSGPGPHKVYWLGADHPDNIGEQDELTERDILGLPEEVYPDTLEIQGSFDILGRPGGKSESIQLQKIGSKWKKVIKVK